MSSPELLLKNNQHWAAQKVADDPNYFTRLAAQHRPKYMWIGCSDSRVPANEIIGLEPGQVFVHRNVANQVHHTDLNCLSAVQYAVDVLDVEHIIVTGHYDCGGVHAAMETQHFGIVDNWIRAIRDTFLRHREQIKHGDVVDQLCEFNVIRQVENLSHTRIVQNAWARGKKLTIHGWIYRLKDGLLHDLDVTRSCSQDVEEIYRVR
ncbi:MAG: carbonate dehydratase [Mariprofundaceae bacterium]